MPQRKSSLEPVLRMLAALSEEERAIVREYLNESEPQDTTAYLLGNPENRKRLLKAVKDIKHGRDVVEVKWDGRQFKKA